MSTVTAPPELLTTAAAATRLAISRATLPTWRALGKGPRYVRIGRAIRYRVADLDAFLAAGTVETGGSAAN